MRTEYRLCTFGGGITSTWSHQGLTATAQDKRSCDTFKGIQFIQQHTKSTVRSLVSSTDFNLYTFLNVRRQATWTLHLVSLRKPLPLQVYVNHKSH